jgi:GNAT superfamily N-acetyltransferase
VRWTLVPLGHHDRYAFRSSKELLNEELRRIPLGSPEHATWVAVPEPESREILGYYSLNPDPVALSDGRADTLGVVPLLYLAFLATHQDYEGHGIRTDMLYRAIASGADLAQEKRVLGLMLDPIDAEAARWYRYRVPDFRPTCPDDPESRLILMFDRTEEALRRVFGVPDEDEPWDGPLLPRVS